MGHVLGINASQTGSVLPCVGVAAKLLLKFKVWTLCLMGTSDTSAAIWERQVKRKLALRDNALVLDSICAIEYDNDP